MHTLSVDSSFFHPPPPLSVSFSTRFLSPSPLPFHPSFLPSSPSLFHLHPLHFFLTTPFPTHLTSSVVFFSVIPSFFRVVSASSAAFPMLPLNDSTDSGFVAITFTLASLYYNNTPTMHKHYQISTSSTPKNLLLHYTHLVHGFL